MPRKGENIYKRKDKRWEARYVKDYNADGSPHFGYCYGKTYAEAKEKLERKKATLFLGLNDTESKSKKQFSFYCDEWLAVNRIRLKESTLVKYRTILENHIKPRLGNCAVKNLSTVLVEKFSQELLYDEKLSAKTVKDILILLSSLFKYTSRHFEGCFPKIEIYYPKSTKKEMRVLTKEEQVRFVRLLLTETDECKFGTLLALLTGMRIGEICALRWKNISLKDATIKIDSTMQRLSDLDDRQGKKTKVVISDPKSENSLRIIPLSDYARDLCAKFKPVCENAFVLSGSAVQFVEPRALQYKMKKYASACGLDGVHFHTLRHTFATRCVEVGFEIKSLSEILGHSSPQITLQRYVHSSLELKRNNMNKLAMVDCF